MEVPRTPIQIECEVPGRPLRHLLYHYIRIGPFVLHNTITTYTPTSQVTITLEREGLALGHFPDWYHAAKAADFLLDANPVVWELSNQDITAWARALHIADTLRNVFGAKWR